MKTTPDENNHNLPAELSHSHPELKKKKLTLVTTGVAKPFDCAVCKREVPAGTSRWYKSGSRGGLHTSCALVGRPPVLVLDSLFPGREFVFRAMAPAERAATCCNPDCADKSVAGFVYDHGGLSLHPCCGELPSDEQLAQFRQKELQTTRQNGKYNYLGRGN